MEQSMTDLLERAVQTVRGLSPEMQDEIAHMLLSYAGDAGHSFQLTPEEAADLDRSDDEIVRGEFATDAQMDDIWKKHGG